MKNSDLTNHPTSEFPVRLRHARWDMRQMKQSELASKSGLTPTAISHFEAGSRKPSFDNLRRLANALDVTTDWLLGRVDDPLSSSVSDPLYRHFANMSDADRETLKHFINAMTSRKDKDPEDQ